MNKFNPLKNKWAAWALWGLWALMVLKFSSEPATVSSGKSGWILDQILHGLERFNIAPNNIDLLHTFIRKTAHFINYLCLGLISFNALKQSMKGTIRQWLMAAFLLTAGFAGFDEYFQTFIPGRSGAVKDVLLDSCGAAVGLFIVWSKKHFNLKN